MAKSSLVRTARRGEWRGSTGFDFSGTSWSPVPFRFLIRGFDPEHHFSRADMGRCALGSFRARRTLPLRLARSAAASRAALRSAIQRTLANSCQALVEAWMSVRIAVRISGLSFGHASAIAASSGLTFPTFGEAIEEACEFAALYPASSPSPCAGARGGSSPPPSTKFISHSRSDVGGS